MKNYVEDYKIILILMLNFNFLPGPDKWKLWQKMLSIRKPVSVFAFTFKCAFTFVIVCVYLFAFAFTFVFVFVSYCILVT